MTDPICICWNYFLNISSSLNRPFLLLQAEAKILRGPHEDLESYIEAVDQLRSNIKFFSSYKGFKTIDGALKHDNNLLAKAIVKLEEEFKQLLSTYRCVVNSVYNIATFVQIISLIVFILCFSHFKGIFLSDDITKALNS